MKKYSIIFIACLQLFVGYNCKKHPLTDPSEIYEKAINKAGEKSYKEAKPLFEESVRLFRELQRMDKLTDALKNLAEVYAELGEFRSALTVSNEATYLMRKEGDIKGTLKLTILEADIFTSAQVYNVAISKYRSVIASALAFGESKLAIDALLKLASVLKINNDLQKALEVYKTAFKQAQAIEDNQSVAVALCGISSIYRLQGQYTEALNSLNQGLLLVNQFSNPVVAAKLRMEMGLLNTSQNNINAALKEFGNAVNILRHARANSEHEIVLLFYIGNLYERNKRYQDAKKYYNEGLKIAKSFGDHISVGYLSIFQLHNDLNASTSTHRIESLDKFKESYQEISEIFQKCRHIAGEGYSYIQIGKYYEVKGDLLKAREYYMKAVKLAEDTFAEYADPEYHKPYQEALGILTSHTDWYEILINVLLKLHRYEEALKTIDYARTRQIARDYCNLEIEIQNSRTFQEVNNIRSKIKRIRLIEAEYALRKSRKEYSVNDNEMNLLLNEIISTKQKVFELSSALINENPNLETLLTPKKIEISHIQKFIQNGATIVEYFATDSLLYIFTLSNSNLIVRRSDVRKKEVFDLVQEYQKLLQEPAVYSGKAGEASLSAMTRFALLSTKLYDILLRPIDDLFKQNIIIVTSKFLEGFPFHALEKQVGRDKVKYLIEIISVDYMPTISSLQYQKVKNSHLKDIVAFGNSTGKNWAVDYELRDIRSFFNKASIMLGIDMTWQNLKSTTGDILQISTDFSGYESDSYLGKMTLSSGASLEQTVTIPFEKLIEIKTIPLVVLSNQNSESKGLTARHALLLQINGTADVFLNVWTADRKASKFFSEYFYANLANGLAPGDSYRQALLNLLKMMEVNQPHSWAQFFHFGVG